MTFRDDHDAALARADALEDEVERTKRERDALADKVKQLEARPGRVEVTSRPTTDSDPDRNTRGATIAGWVTAGVVGALLLGFVLYRSCDHDKQTAAWEARRDARTQAKKRWVALVSVEECARRVAADSSLTRQNFDADLHALTQRGYTIVHPLANTCARDAALLIGAIAPPASEAIRQWIEAQDALRGPTQALQDYFSHRDFVEDNYAGAAVLWKPVRALLDRQAAALQRLHADAFPVIRRELRELLAKHETATGRDLTYWRGTIAIAQWECNDLAFASGGVYAGRPPDLGAASTAMRPRAVALMALLPQAPIEVRRDARSIDFSMIGSVATGGVLAGPEAMFELISREASWIGRGTGDRYVAALPPEPGPPPEEPFGEASP